jgi:hypothetical protein
MKEGEMEKARKLWIPVLLGVLLIAFVVGVAGARGHNRTSGALGPTAYITIPGAAFNPKSDGADWYNTGKYIRNMSANDDLFYAGPIVFPHAGAVQITEFALLAYDNSGLDGCAHLHKSRFMTGAYERMAYVCSTGSLPGVRRFSTSTISAPQVNPQYAGCSVSLALEGAADVRIYAVRIAYRPVL